MSSFAAANDSRTAHESQSGDLIRLPRLWGPLVVFLVLALGIGFAGYAYHKHEEEALVAETQKALASIAELKIRQIAEWRDEQIRDAVVAAKDHTMITAMNALLRDPGDTSARQEIVLALDTLKRVYRYQQVIDRKSTRLNSSHRT